MSSFGKTLIIRKIHPSNTNYINKNNITTILHIIYFNIEHIIDHLQYSILIANNTQRDQTTTLIIYIHSYEEAIESVRQRPFIAHGQILLQHAYF